MRVEGTLDGLMYIGRPDHLLYLTQLEYKAIYSLTRFTRSSNFDLEAPIRIGDRVIAPSPVVRVLGLQLDSKLCWEAHIKAVNQKMKT